MADSYVSVETCTLENILAAALADGFAITDRVHFRGRLVQCGLIHADGRGCYGLGEEERANGQIHVSSMNNPHVSGCEMHQLGAIFDDEFEEDCAGEGEDDKRGKGVATAGKMPRAGRPQDYPK